MALLHKVPSTLFVCYGAPMLLCAPASIAVAKLPFCRYERMETELAQQYAVYLENFRNLEFLENELGKFNDMVPSPLSPPSSPLPFISSDPFPSYFLAPSPNHYLWSCLLLAHPDAIASPSAAPQLDYLVQLATTWPPEHGTDHAHVRLCCQTELAGWLVYEAPDSHIVPICHPFSHSVCTQGLVLIHCSLPHVFAGRAVACRPRE